MKVSIIYELDLSGKQKVVKTLRGSNPNKQVDSKDSNDKQVLLTGSNSKCGEGTIFDEETYSCILEK